MKYFIFFLLFMAALQAYPQDKAIEIYMRKKPSKNFIIRIDDKVLIKCRHYNAGYNRMVVARLAVIDSNKFYFYPVNKQYRESIFTLSTLNEIGVKTTLTKIYAVYAFASRTYNVIRGGMIDLPGNEYYNYKVVNVKTLKWEVKVIDE